jgi:hypothetical protein
VIGGFVIESRSGARKASIKFAKVNVWRPFDALPRTSIIRRARGATLFDDGLSKDNVCIAGIPMTCASRVLEGYVPHIDPTIIRRILDTDFLR